MGDLNVMYDWTDIAQLDYTTRDACEMIKSMMFWVEETGIDGFVRRSGRTTHRFLEVGKDSLWLLITICFSLLRQKPELNESALMHITLGIFIIR